MADLVARALETVNTLLDFADSRQRAWAVAGGAGLLTAGAWWFGHVRAIPDLATRTAASVHITAVDRLFVLVAVLAPFVAVNALWQAVGRPTDVGDPQEDFGPLRAHYTRLAGEQRRRRMLVAALIGVLNGFAIYITTH